MKIHKLKFFEELIKKLGDRILTHHRQPIDFSGEQCRKAYLMVRHSSEAEPKSPETFVKR